MRAVFAWIGDWLPPALHFALAGKSAETSPGEPVMSKLPNLITRLRHSVDFHSEVTRIFHRELTRLMVMVCGLCWGQGMGCVLFYSGSR